MPITIDEQKDSRPAMTGEDSSVELKYLIQGTTDEAEALEALADKAPETWGDLVRKTWNVEPILVDVAGGVGIWGGVVRYGYASASLKPKAVGESSFSFDTGGGTQHITQAKEHIASYAPEGQTPGDYQGAIGVTDDGVEGVDIVVPVYNFSETWCFAAADVDETYKGKLYALTGKVCNAQFRGCAAGECLFMGASGSQRGNGDWEITFKFAASPNVTGMTIGAITGIAKQGWHYLWVRYEDAEDSGAKRLVKRPAEVHVERVYDLGNFGDLGIG